MRKIKRFLVSLLLSMFIMFSFLELPTIADFGDFESYDSGSSWDSSSSWDSGSTWDSDSSWDSSSYSGGSGGGFIYIGDGFRKVYVYVCFIFDSAMCNFSYFAKRKTNQTSFNKRVNLDEAYRQINPFNRDENAIENAVQVDDKLFNKAEFLSFASDLFIKLQYAWSDRNLESVRVYQTPELYEQTLSQIKRYIMNKQINKLERVSVNLAKLYSFEKKGDRDCLSVAIQSKMIDYIINEATGSVIKGDKNTNKVNTYILTFVRKTGTKTREDGKVISTTNCPNCGAPTEILSSGKCEYCGSIITTSNHGWALASLKRYNSNMS